jgi:hypothetical protein
MTKANDDLNKATPRDRNAPRGITADHAAKVMQPAVPGKTPPRPGAKDQQLNSGPVQQHTNIVRGKR